MSKNKIYIDVEVDDNGSTKKVALEADRLQKALNESSSANNKNNKTQRETYRVSQGVAQNTSNTTKSFAKQAQGIRGGLVPAYATLAANAFALSAAFGALQRTAALEKLEEGIIALGAASGQTLPIVANRLKELTGFAVSSEQALRTTAIAVSSGFNTSQLERLTKVAKGASVTLGRDLGDSLDRLVRGTAKLEPEILDELGIIVRLDQASERYASTLNKQVNQLTQYEKQQAFLNATLEQGESKYGAINDLVDANPYDKLIATFNDLTRSVLKLVNTALTPLINFFGESQLALGSALTVFGSTIINQITPAIAESVQASKQKYEQAAVAAKRSASESLKAFQRASANLSKVSFAPKGFKQVEESIRRGVATTKQYETAIKSLEKSIAARSAATKRATTKNIEKVKEEKQAIIDLRKEILNLQKDASRVNLAGGPVAARARAQSRNARRQSVALEAMEGTGLIGQLKIASATTLKYAKDTAIAEGASNKLKLALSNLGRSAGLFGRVFLSAIPVIGQLSFALALLAPAFEKLFGKTNYEKTIDKVNDSFEDFSKTMVSLRDQLDKTTDANEKFFKSFRAAPGVIDFAKSSINALKDAQVEQRVSELSRLQDELIKVNKKIENQPVARDFGVLGSVSLNEIRKTQLEQQIEALKTAEGTLSSIDIKNIFEQIETRLNFAGLTESMPEVLKAFEDFKRGLEDTGESVTISELENFLKGLDLTQEQMNRVIGAVDGGADAFQRYSQEANKLVVSTNTKFTNSIDALNGVFGGLKTVLNDSADDFLKQQMAVQAWVASNEDSAKVLEALFGKSVPEISVKDINDYSEKLSETNQKWRTQSSVIAKAEEKLKNIKQLSSDSIIITEDRIKAEGDVVKAKVDQVDLTEKILRNLLGEKFTQENLAVLEAERAAIKSQKLSDEEKSLIRAEAAFNQEKATLGITRKRAQAASNILKAEEQLLRNRADRQELASSNEMFGFLDAERRQLDAKISIEEALLEKKIKALQQEASMKKTLIDAEYTLIEARLEAQRKETENPEERNRLGTLISSVDEARRQSLDAVDMEAKVGVDNLLLSLEKLRDSREDLEDINVLTQDIGKSVESNMVSAFDNIIQGTSSVKDAFKNMAVAILQDISRMIARMLVFKLIQTGVDFFGGFGGTPPASAGYSFNQAPSVGIGSATIAARNGGMFEPVPGYAEGGIARGREAGYPAVLHGTEAVVPLPNNRSIPVELSGNAGGTNNVTVNVSMDSSGSTQQNSQQDSQQAGNLGNIIAAAVQKELQNQKRAGGILSPYGAS